MFVHSDVAPPKLFLKDHKRRTVSEDLDQCSRLYILRSDLWKTALTAFKRPTFDVTKNIKVVFVGEPSVDDGGPLQEMFTLLLNHIARFSGLFEGRDGHVIPAHNLSRLNTGEYYIAGKIIATSLVHGCRAPHCFSQSIVEYIMNGKIISQPDPKVIPDYEIQQKVIKVQPTLYMYLTRGILIVFDM